MVSFNFLSESVWALLVASYLALASLAISRELSTHSSAIKAAWTDYTNNKYISVYTLYME